MSDDKTTSKTSRFLSRDTLRKYAGDLGQIGAAALGVINPLAGGIAGGVSSVFGAIARYRETKALREELDELREQVRYLSGQFNTCSPRPRSPRPIAAPAPA